jgi:hypothetical protein
LHDRASVSVEVVFAAFSGTDRKRRAKSDKYVYLGGTEYHIKGSRADRFIGEYRR